MTAWHTVKPIYYVTASMSLVVLIVVGAAAVIHFRKEPNVSALLKLLFYLSLISASFGLICFLIQHTLDQDWGGIGTAIGATMFFLFMLILLGTLVIRLHITFRSSVYRMTTIQRSFFVSILGVMSLSTGMVMLNGFIQVFDIEDFERRKFLYAAYISVFLVGSVVAVYLFIHNLRLLINTRSAFKYNMNVTVDAIQLDESQRKLGDLAARYLLLFSVATFSTISLWTGVLILDVWMKPLIPVDWTINVICVYLQFGFVSHHYQRLCGFADKCCRAFVSNRARHSIRRATVESQSPKPTSSSTGLELSATSNSSQNVSTPESNQTQ